MVIALTEIGLRAEQQKPIPVYFRRRRVGDFKCDVLVESEVMVELKTAKVIAPDHIAQTLNYLKATEVEVALILDFGERPLFKRLLFDNDRKKPLTSSNKP